MSQYLYLAELVAYVPGTRSATTLRYATGLGHVTGPAETPANTFYDARLQQPGTLTRTAFGPGRTSGRSVTGFGDLVLENGDGELDPILEYGFDGRAVTVRRGLVGAAYPGGFTTIFAGTMEQVDAVGQTIVVKLRDKQADLDTPLQVVTYTGANVLPAGLEGNADDLKGKPKPVCYGNVENVPAPCVNTTKLIYQVQEDRANAVPITAISAVYDRGVAVAPGLVPVLVDTGENNPAQVASLCYGNGIWLAGINNDNLYSSPDATAWTARVTNLTAAWSISACAYGGGVYVIGNSLGEIASSTDGFTWVARVSNFGGNSVNAITYADFLATPLFVATGNNGRICTSADGTTWTTRTGASANGMNAACVGGELVVIVGSGLTVQTSPDGITWTQRGSALGTWAANAVAYDAVSNSFFAGGAYVSPYGVNSFRSADGLTWYKVDNPLGAYSLLALVAQPGGGFVAAGSTGRYATSLDGVTWVLSAGTTLFGTTTYRALATSGSSLLAGGDGVGAGTNTLLSFASARDYANTTELEDDTLAPGAGLFCTHLAGGYFRLGAPPAGLITADVEHGITNPALLWAKVLGRAGKVTGDWSASDVTTVSAAANLSIGFWQGPDGDATFSDLLTRIAESVGAWWGVDRTGVYRIKQLLAPSGTAVASFTANDLLRPPVRLALGADPTRGLPQWRTFLTYQHNYAVQDTDLAGAVTDVRRAFLALADREAVFEDTLVREAHLNAPESHEDTLLQVAANALTEATRRQVMRGILRHRYELVVKLDDDTDTLDLGDVISLTHDRYGLSGGALFTVLGIAHDFRRNRVTLTVWGPQDPVSLLRLRAPVLAGTGTVT